MANNLDDVFYEHVYNEQLEGLSHQEILLI